MDRAGSDEREALAQAEAVRVPELEAAVATSLTRSTRANAAPPSRSTAWRWAAAASIAALAGWAVWDATRPPEPPAVYLGDTRLSELDASGLFTDGPVTWKGRLAGHERYLVEILDASSAERPARVVLQSPQLEESAWKPAENDVTKLPERVRVSVRIVNGADGTVLRADVSRSPR